MWNCTLQAGSSRTKQQHTGCANRSWQLCTACPTLQTLGNLASPWHHNIPQRARMWLKQTPDARWPGSLTFIWLSKVHSTQPGAQTPMWGANSRKNKSRKAPNPPCCRAEVACMGQHLPAVLSSHRDQCSETGMAVQTPLTALAEQVREDDVQGSTDEGRRGACHPMENKSWGRLLPVTNTTACPHCASHVSCPGIKPRPCNPIPKLNMSRCELSKESSIGLQKDLLETQD